MNFVKAWYEPGRGYKLYMPDGAPIPGCRETTISDEWIESSSKAGEDGFKLPNPYAFQTLVVEVVNEEPVSDKRTVDEVQAIINVNMACNPHFKVAHLSDGYHTFDELYQHRIALFKTLCIQLMNGSSLIPVWKSKFHYDTTSIKGWFIAGIHTDPGKQITYHVPMSEWNTWPGDEFNIAPEWDGHTSADVLKRLAEL